METTIRPYQDSDWETVRKIAASTASGYPRRDLQLVADLLTNYYVNHEPGHLLVAEVEGKTVGYLSGCFNTLFCSLTKAIKVVPKAIAHALCRGEVGWKELRYLGAFIYVTMHGGLRNHPPSDYPAHFHINVAEGYRGLGIGTSLLERFLAMLKKADVSGVHVRVRQGDTQTVGFFKSFGFSRKNSYPIVMKEKNGFRTSRSVIYTKKL